MWENTRVFYPDTIDDVVGGGNRTHGFEVERYHFLGSLRNKFPTLFQYNFKAARTADSAPVNQPDRQFENIIWVKGSI